MLNLWYNCFLLTPVILRSIEMTFLTKALGSRKRQQLYNFTITIFHYDYKIMKLNCNMKLLVTLFSVFNIAIFGHFVSLYRAPFWGEATSITIHNSYGDLVSLHTQDPFSCASHLPWTLTFLNSFLPPSLLIATFTSLTSCLALECTSDSEFCGVVGYIEEITLWEG